MSFKTGTPAQLPQSSGESLRPVSRVQARVSHIQAVIPLCERVRQEEFLRNNCHWGALILAEGRESVAASAGEINGTDKRNRYQNYQGGE